MTKKTEEQGLNELLIILIKNNCEVIAKIDEQSGKRLIIKTTSGIQHNIIIRFLNLDESRSLKIPKSDFNYELRENLWVLLLLYMKDMEPFSYLIPSKVFHAPNTMFIDNEQPAMFSHLSNWEIKVFRKGIEELSKYAFETIINDLR